MSNSHFAVPAIYKPVFILLPKEEKKGWMLSFCYIV
jgi:hypothetical protein